MFNESKVTIPFLTVTDAKKVFPLYKSRHRRSYRLILIESKYIIIYSYIRYEILV